jgi:hypothetical protein
MTKGSTQDTLDLVDRIRAAGFTCELNGSGHWKVTRDEEDGGERMYGVFSATPSSARSLNNAIADLRRTTGVDFRVQRRTPRKDERPVDDKPDPRKVALLADRNRNDKLLAEAERRAAEQVSIPASVAALKATLESPERRNMNGAPVMSKDELDQQAVNDAVTAALTQQPGVGNKRYPVLQPPRLVTFTPAQMAELLDVSVCNTRPPQRSTVEKYEGRMRRGQWRVTHQGVAIDWHGCVLDGRQRFLAAIKAGFNLTIYATYGMDPAAFFAMDDGKTRTAGDSIAMADLHWYVTTDKGERKEIKPTRTALAAAVTLCLNLDRRDANGNPLGRYEVEHTAYSKEEIVDALRIPGDDGEPWEEGPYFDLGYYTTQTSELMHHVHMTRTAAYAALFMTHREHPGGPHGIWHQQLITGANLSANSPALKLIRVLGNAAAAGKRANSRGGMTTLGQYALYVKAWNAFLSGKSVGQLHWREDEDIPVPFNPLGSANRRRNR